MAGNRPDYRLTAVTKDKNADNKREYTDLFGCWPLERDGQAVNGVYSASMRPFGKIADIYIVVVDEDGNRTKISGDTHFFNLRHQSADGGGNGGGRKAKAKAAQDEDF